MKNLLTTILCLSVFLSFLSMDKIENETIYEKYHNMLLNEFNLTYEGVANNYELRLTLRDAFPAFFDEVKEIHLYKNINNSKFKYVYKVEGLLGDKASAIAVKVERDSFNNLTFEGSCPNSDPCLADCKTCACEPDQPIGVICGCIDNITGECNVF